MLGKESSVVEFYIYVDEISLRSEQKFQCLFKDKHLRQAVTKTYTTGRDSMGMQARDGRNG